MFISDETLAAQSSDTPVETPEEVVAAPAADASAPRSDRRERSGGNKGRRDGGGRRREMRPEDKEFNEQMLGIDRVTRVTAGGRQLRFRAAIVLGDGKGRVGLGTGKSAETSAAVEKAGRDARKRLIKFPMVNGTIPHAVTVKFQATKLMIHPAAPGTGIIAGGAARKVFAAAGLKDILAKRYGSRNDLTTAQAALNALSQLKTTTPKFAQKSAQK